jgi:hypothetical protein
MTLNFFRRPYKSEVYEATEHSVLNHKNTSLGQVLNLFTWMSYLIQPLEGKYSGITIMWLYWDWNVTVWTASHVTLHDQSTNITNSRNHANNTA